MFYEGNKVGNGIRQAEWSGLVFGGMPLQITLLCLQRVKELQRAMDEFHNA